MENLDRRSAVALGVATVAMPAAATLAAARPAAAQTRGSTEGKEIRPGVRQIDLSPPRPSKIEGFKTVSMRDLVFQPGAEIPEFPMTNPMACQVTEGELTIRQDGREFVAKIQSIVMPALARLSGKDQCLTSRSRWFAELIHPLTVRCARGLLIGFSA